MAKEPMIIMVCGPTDVGKSHIVETVFGLEFEVTTEKVDAIYRKALADAGIPSNRVRREAEALRSGAYPQETVDAFFASWTEAIRAAIQRSTDWGVALVLDGYTLGAFPDEAERVIQIATEVQGQPPRVHRMLIKPPLAEWNRNHARRMLLTQPGMPFDEWGEEYYAQEFPKLTPVTGIKDHVVTNDKKARLLAEEGLRLRPHKWYQMLRAGQVRLQGASDAREKAATFAHEDIDGKSVLDVCCATGIVSMLVRDRGAQRVCGVEIDPRKHAKSLELQKVLLRHTAMNAKADFRLGDAREVVPTLGRFDTVFMLGALHDFEDMEGMLTMLADAAKSAVYVEFLLPDISGVWNGEPGVQAYERRTGTTVYAADSQSLINTVIPNAMPGFELVRRIPTAGVGRGVDSYREVWQLRRT